MTSSETEVGIERIDAADVSVRKVCPEHGVPGSADGGELESDTAALTSAALREYARLGPVGVAVAVGESCLVSYANPAFRKALGADDRLIVGRPLFDAFPALNDGRIRAVVSAAIAKASEEIAMVASASLAHGRAAGRATLIVSPIERNGAQRAVMILLRDPIGADRSAVGQPTPHEGPDEARAEQGPVSASELLEVNQRLVVAALREQELKESAEAASKAKSAFLAMMSHELRTPLNAIIGYASLLDDEIWGPIAQEQHKHLERLKTSARHLLALVNDVLSLARVEAEKEVVYQDDVDASELLEEVLALTAPLAVAKGLEFTVTEGESFKLCTDRGKVLQILVNLVSNAIKFTNDGGITLGASVRNGVSEFSVRDTGIGISRENFDHIFDMFWQVNQDLTRRVGGTGLGLNVSRRLAELIGGRLSVESISGEGSLFTVYLPVRRAEAEIGTGD